MIVHSRSRPFGLLITALACFSLPCAAQRAPESSAAERAQRLVAYFDRATQFGFSGAVLFAANGQVLVRRGFGAADRRTGRPVTPTTAFHLASLDKQFIATGVLALVADHRLSLDAPIRTFLPAAAEHYASVTVRHVLSHRGGLPNVYRDAYPTVTYAAYVDSVLRSMPARSRPGTAFRYSNLDYDVLSRIIEVVTGAPYEQHLRDRLFLRAGMQRTGNRLVRWPSDSVALYQEPLVRDAWPSIGDAIESPLMRPPFLRDQQLLSTIDDLLRWDRALRSDQVLPPEFRKQLSAPLADDYGFGWSFGTGPDDRAIQYHGGYDTGLGIAAIFARDPATDWVVVILTNTIASRQLSSDVLMRTAGTILAGGEVPLPPKASQIAPASRPNQGVYRLNDQAHVTLAVTAGGVRLLASDVTATTLLLFPDAMGPLDALPRDSTMESLMVALSRGNADSLRNRAVNPADAEDYVRDAIEVHQARERAFGALRGVIVSSTVRREDLGETWRFLVSRHERGAAADRLVVTDAGKWFLSPVRVGRPYELPLALAPDGTFTTWSFALNQAMTARFDATGLELTAANGRRVYLRRQDP
jgi:CubicO group peptidase (beta-lactamase class C family)